MDNSDKKPLFRQDAVDSKRERLHGDILLIPRISHTIVNVFLVIWLLVLAIWLATSTYSQKETVLGWLDFPVGVVRIYPQQTGGMVDSLLVEEGQSVEQGQSLLPVKASRVLRNGGNLSSELLSEYEQQKQRIVLQLDRELLIASGRESSLQAKVSSAEKELSLIN